MGDSVRDIKKEKTIDCKAETHEISLINVLSDLWIISHLLVVCCFGICVSENEKSVNT